MPREKTEIEKIKKDVETIQAMLNLWQIPKELKTSNNDELIPILIVEIESSDETNDEVLDTFEFVEKHIGWTDEICKIRGQCIDCADPGIMRRGHRSSCINCNQPDLGMQAVN
ncbi:hypothetical protein ISS06_00480 [Patescibacteria group bacterium]|nr:hypothetical protein [Patescibacteria group bacterium]